MGVFLGLSAWALSGHWVTSEAEEGSRRVREKIQAPKKGRVWVKPEAQVQGTSSLWNKQGSRSSVGLAGDMQLHWLGDFDKSEICVD